ncbi:uncharacterized protein LOC103711765 [Phoenix dactylifera]|uniref:Uncharacterized protein LOC103711765 n=1 Tax=Phoenix dactylifera TaxID=42345 RepID=A0A8B8J725_PHODC|nr:uncharacterized protein LOC103711765 [Phoenix dactylifera]
MIAGDGESEPGDSQLEMVQPSLVVTDDIMTRRLKNRERQRRYRARKRLEADMKKSCLHALLPSETQSNGIFINVNPYQFVLPLEAHSNGDTFTYEARVYSGRKWKQDARRAHLLQELMDPSNVPSVPPPHLIKPPLEAGSNLECHTNPTGKRDWKADARNKVDVDVRTPQ